MDSSSRRDYVDEPSPADVICGRGKSGRHPGNARLKEKVEEKREEYQKALRREEKTRITAEIVAELRRGPDPCRFLLKDTNGKWYDAGEEYAREKVSHALRSRPKEDVKKKTKTKKRLTRKPTFAPELEQRISELIDQQQQLLYSMMNQRMTPAIETEQR